MENGAERDLLVSGRGPRHTAPGWRAAFVTSALPMPRRNVLCRFSYNSLRSLLFARISTKTKDCGGARSSDCARSLGHIKNFVRYLQNAGARGVYYKWLFPDIRSNQLCLEKSLKKDSPDHSLKLDGLKPSS